MKRQCYDAPRLGSSRKYNVLVVLHIVSTRENQAFFIPLLWDSSGFDPCFRWRNRYLSSCAAIDEAPPNQQFFDFYANQHNQR